MTASDLAEGRRPAHGLPGFLGQGQGRLGRDLDRIEVVLGDIGGRDIDRDLGIVPGRELRLELERGFRGREGPAAIAQDIGRGVVLVKNAGVIVGRIRRNGTEVTEEACDRDGEGRSPWRWFDGLLVGLARESSRRRGCIDRLRAGARR